MSSHRRQFATAAVVAVAALFGACGGGSDEDKIESTMKDFGAAFADGDGKKACEQLTENAQKELQRQANTANCEDAIKKAGEQIDQKTKDRLKDFEVRDIKVNGDTATVRTSVDDGDDEPTRLRKVDGEWKLEDNES
jgi:ketosteroid isomerase-like protein